MAKILKMFIEEGEYGYPHDNDHSYWIMPDADWNDQKEMDWMT
jgi:hypothetical protein